MNYLWNTNRANTQDVCSVITCPFEVVTFHLLSKNGHLQDKTSANLFPSHRALPT
jgi:hypothetical protein